MKKKVIKLTAVSETSYILLGISSHENDYRLSWAINKFAGTSFKRINNYILSDKKNNREKEFSQFEYNDEESFIKILLLSNHSENGFLIPELKNMDFFMALIGDVDETYTNELLKKLKSIDIISMAAQIDPLNLKSRENLLFNF